MTLLFVSPFIEMHFWPNQNSVCSEFTLVKMCFSQDHCFAMSLTTMIDIPATTNMALYIMYTNVRVSTYKAHTQAINRHYIHSSASLIVHSNQYRVAFISFVSAFIYIQRYFNYFSIDYHYSPVCLFVSLFKDMIDNYKYCCSSGCYMYSSIIFGKYVFLRENWYLSILIIRIRSKLQDEIICHVHSFSDGHNYAYFVGERKLI